jgi:hypothetical protein
MGREEEAKAYAKQLGYTEKDLPREPGGFVEHASGDFEFPDRGKRNRKGTYVAKYKRLSIPSWLHLEIKYRSAKSGMCLSQWLSKQLGIEPPYGFVYKER